MALHRTLTTSDGIHYLQAYSYADQTAREAATGFTAADVGKVARQEDTGGFYILTVHDPAAWLSLGGSFTNPMSQVGDVIYGGSAGVPTRLAGADGSYFRSKGTGGAPTFTRDLDVGSLVASAIIDATAHASAILQADSTTRGFLQPRMTAVQRDAIAAPAQGLGVFVTDAKRPQFWDGTNWLQYAVKLGQQVVVADDGSGDFDSIQDAIDSITGATDINRYVVLVSPGVYVEDVTMADFIAVQGFGWDTLIQGQIICTGLTDTTLSNLRVESTNVPCLTCGVNTDGEVNVVDCFMFSNWDDSVAPTTERRAVDVTQGILYIYKESEVTLAVDDLVNTASTTHQCVFLVHGSGEAYVENYGTYTYIDTNNPGNTLGLLHSTNTNAATQMLFRLGEFAIDGTGTHSNPCSLICMFEAAGVCGMNAVRFNVSLPGSGSGSIILLDVQSSQVSGARANATNCTIVPFGTIADANIYTGRATTVNDTVQVINVLFDVITDVQPGRETTGGSAGTFQYELVNNFGTRWSSGLYNGAEVNADVTDWANVAAALGGQAAANLYIFRADGAGGGAMVPNKQIIFNSLTVGKSGDVDYNTIKAAVDYATGQGVSASNPWEIKVYPGTYSEAPMSIGPGIVLVSQSNRIDTVFVVASNASEDLFTCTGGYFGGLNVSGVTDAAKCIWRCATASSLVVLHGISLRNCSQGVVCSGGASVICTNNSINLTGVGQSVTTGYTVTGTGSYMGHNGGFFSVPSALLPAYATNPVQTVFRVADGARFTVAGATASIAYKTTDADVLLADGGSTTTILACEVRNSGTGAHIGSSGTGTTIVAQAGVWVGNNLNGKSDSSTGVFLVSSASGVLGFSTVAGTVLSGLIQVISEGYTYIAGNAAYQFVTQKTLDFQSYFHDQTSTGLSYGGGVTAATGLNVDVAAGHGWVTRHDPYHDSWNVEWDADTDIALTASTTNYVVYDSTTETLLAQTTAHSTSQILLATVVTDGSGIRFLHKTRHLVHDESELLHNYLLNTRRIAWQTGLAVTEGTSNRKFDVSTGSWYVALDTVSATGDTDVTFSYFYGSGGATEVASQTELDITYYDNAGTLTAMTTNYYRADTLVVTSDGRFSVIYGTAEFVDEDVAALTTNKASIPSFMADTGCYAAMFVVKQGDGITQIVDIRPDPNAATAGGGGGGGSGDHSALVNLDKPGDHTWAMLVDGTRAMSGALNMGTNNISNAGTINGVTITAHASRHNPGGADALTTAAPGALQVGASPAEGTAGSYARSDHQHGTAAPGTPPAIAATGSAGSGTTPALDNHTHAHGSQTTATHHAACTTSANGFMSSTDKTKLDGIATGATNTPLTSTAPVNVTKAAAAVGTSGEAARQDHKHDITTAAAGAAAPGDTTAEGSATSLARSDHRHSLPAFGTGSGTFCEGNDARLSDNRTDADAIHDNVSGEINVITEKVTPVAADLVIIEDSAASYGKKKVQVGNLPGGTGGATVLAAVQARRLTSLTMPTAWTDVDFPTTDVETTPTVIDHLAGTPDRIQVLVSGTYLVIYQFEVQPISTGAFYGRVRINDTTVLSGSSQSSITYGGESDVISINTIANLSAGDFLTVQNYIVTTGTMAANATFAVYKLDGVQGAPGSGSTITIQDEGGAVPGGPHSIVNFAGTGVTATDAGGGAALVTIPGSGFFGQEFQQEETSTAAQTASTTYAAYLTLTTPVLPAGTYRVGWSITARCTNVSYDMMVRVQVDNATTLDEYQLEPKDTGTDQRDIISGFGYIILTNDTHVVDLDLAVSSTLATAVAYRGRIEFWRVS